MIDVHLHLQERPWRDEVSEVLATCREAGVSYQVVHGTGPDDWEEVAALREDHPQMLRACYGVHPWKAQEVPAGWEKSLEGFLEGALGIGEVGLDKGMRDHDLAKQKEIFGRQLDMAADRELSVTIHCVQAFGHLLDMLQEGRVDPERCLLHSYSGSVEMLPRFAELGVYFSLSGYFFHERRRDLLEKILEEVPSERLLLETDAPHMNLPQGLEAYGAGAGGGNHPANLVVICRLLAEARAEDWGELEKRLDENARRFFGCGRRPVLGEDEAVG